LEEEICPRSCESWVLLWFSSLGLIQGPGYYTAFLHCSELPTLSPPRPPPPSSRPATVGPPSKAGGKHRLPSSPKTLTQILTSPELKKGRIWSEKNSSERCLKSLRWVIVFPFLNIVFRAAFNNSSHWFGLFETSFTLESWREDYQYISITMKTVCPLRQEDGHQFFERCPVDNWCILHAIL